NAHVVVQQEDDAGTVAERGADAEVRTPGVPEVFGAPQHTRTARERVADWLARAVVDHDQVGHPRVRPAALDTPAPVPAVLPVDAARADAHVTISSYTAGVRRAVSSHVKAAAGARPAVRSAARVSGSATSRAIAAASSAGSERATRRPASPTTSGIDVLATAT